MARRDDGKDAALAASRTLNSDPQKVTDPAFAAGGFFDPADLLQVKYEMVRRVEVDGVPVSAAASAFGFARQSVYNARAALAAGGLAALIPAKPGPKGGHKLTGPVLDHLEALLEQDPRLAPASWPRRPRSGSASRCIPARCAGRWNGGPPIAGPGPPDRRRRKAASTAESGSAADQPGPLSWPGADPAAGRYEALRAIALAGAGGGWRYQLPVLAARGMASWLAQEPAGPCAGDLQAAAMPQAGPSLSAPDPVLPGTSTNGGDARPPACTSLPLTAEIVAVLAQMALHHAR